MLKVRIFSFGFHKNNLPTDDTGNGGGFVFDCRYITNPGKFEQYKNKSGLDFEVKLFLETQTEMPDFLKKVFPIIESAIKKYNDINYTDLMISFGCTGGRHRSVYAAESCGKYISERFPNVLYEINHTILN